jgi:hypothetical protein
MRDLENCVAVFAATTMPQTWLLPDEQPVILSDRVSQYMYLVDLPPYKTGVERAKLSFLWPSWTSTTAPVLLLTNQRIGRPLITPVKTRSQQPFVLLFDAVAKS